MSKLGLKEGLKAGLVTLLLLGLFGKLLGEPYLILYCLEFGIVGLVLSELFKRRLPIGATIFWGTVSLLFMGAVFLFLIGMSKNEGPVDMILGYLQSSLSKTVGIYENAGLDQEKLGQIKQALELLNKLIKEIYPALIIIGTGLIVWINVILSKPLFRIGGLNYPAFEEGGKWCAPEFIVWGAIGAGFALFLPETGIRFLAVNLLAVLTVIYVFHGLSIMMFFFNKHGMPRWARVLIYILILLQQLFLILLAFVGLFDQWADFRKLHKKIDPEAA
jgi:uncharacterized protein YybS (DUF2232 family)